MHKTRISWWIREGAATLEGSDLVPGQVGKPEAEALLDHATARRGRDLKTLPRFCSVYYCNHPDDWGIISTEEEENDDAYCSG